jgi:hypothetical protein
MPDFCILTSDSTEGRETKGAAGWPEVRARNTGIGETLARDLLLLSKLRERRST